MAIESIAIENFQSHKSTELTLSPTVNSLEGISDSGKSAILRSILWAITNKPDGIAFASSWAKNAKGKLSSPVSVTIDGIKRTRSETFNGYESPFGEYEALKGAVPPEIEKAFNVGDVNIQRQMDGPFLMGMTSGDAARYVNSLIGLEEIDSYQKVLKGFSRDCSAELKSVEGAIANIEKDIGKYDWIANAKAKAAELESVCAKCTALENEVSVLGTLSDIVDLESDIARKTHAVESSERLVKAIPDESAIASDVSTISEYLDISSRYTALLKIRDSADPLISAINENKASALSQDFALLNRIENIAAVDDSICRHNTVIEKSDAIIEKLTDILRTIEENEMAVENVNEVNRLGVSIALAADELELLKKDISGQCCPTCGRPL